MKDYQINMFQAISLTGLVVSLMAQLGLMLMNKKIENFYFLYIVWAAVFSIATLWRYYKGESSNSHHHHHHH